MNGGQVLQPEMTTVWKPFRLAVLKGLPEASCMSIAGKGLPGTKPEASNRARNWACRSLSRRCWAATDEAVSRPQTAKAGKTRARVRNLNMTAR